MNASIGVIGAGSWGTALAKVLGDNGTSTLLWAREKELCRRLNEGRENERYLPGARLATTVEVTNDLERVCKSCPLVFLVVPSHALRAVVQRMGDWLGGDQMIVHGVKGIEPVTAKRMSQVIREETCVRKIGVLAGPNLAPEVAARRPSGSVVFSRYEEVVVAAQAALTNGQLRVYGGRDVIGAEVGGAFKNIVAIAAGMADGLGLGDNAKALLLARGLIEMMHFGNAMGAAAITFTGMAGVGDLSATCFSPLSRNHAVGLRLARGESLAQIEQGMFMVAEGVKTTAAARSYGAEQGLSLPIVEAVFSVLYRGVTFTDALAEFLVLQTGEELAGVELKA
jgi:glycerol-3-phosphate dehydrogenase (NAD(P)+)